MSATQAIYGSTELLQIADAVAREKGLSKDSVLEAMEQGKDIFKRSGVHYKFFPLAYYPGYLKKVMLQYPALLHLKHKSSLSLKCGGAM